MSVAYAERMGNASSASSYLPLRTADLLRPLTDIQAWQDDTNMPTRYQQLRQAIARLGWNADEQHAYLERILDFPRPVGTPTGYGNDELLEEFDGIYMAVGDMRDWGEITQDEIDAAKPLDDLFKRWIGPQNADFWRREALWSDARWEQVRQCARKVLIHYPDEKRASDWIRDRY